MPLWYHFGMMYYDYATFKNDVHLLKEHCEPFQADTILALARGGMSLAHALCMALDVRNLQSIRIESYDGQSQRDTLLISGTCDFTASSKVLIVDDIVDSGKTLHALLPWLSERYPTITFKTAALFSKPTAIVQPDFFLHEATEWIDFYWERDFLTEGSI